jgi:hypothetical protein
MSPTAPDACTLPAVDRPQRLGDMDALFAAALHTAERVDARYLHLTFTARDGVEDAVRDLVARECSCCSFFDFAITANAAAVLLDVRVPATQTEMLDTLADRAAAATAAQAAR